MSETTNTTLLSDSTTGDQRAPMRHTPGERTVQQHDTMGGLPLWFVFGSGNIIASFENRADAQLDTAAPELLESLRHAVKIIRKYVPQEALGMDSQGGGDGWNDQSWPILDEYLHHMDAAIAKATGSA